MVVRRKMASSGGYKLWCSTVSEKIWTCPGRFLEGICEHTMKQLCGLMSKGRGLKCAGRRDISVTSCKDQQRENLYPVLSAKGGDQSLGGEP